MISILRQLFCYSPIAVSPQKNFRRGFAQMSFAKHPNSDV